MTPELITLASLLGDELKQRSLMLATAESCTGGGLGYTITSVSGSSDWFERGFITYTDISKIEMLGVHQDTLEIFGAVSEPVAEEMVKGALRFSQADVSIAITGIAGPTGGTKDKPVGTVCTAYAGKNIPTKICIDNFPGDREAIRLGVIRKTIETLSALLKSGR
jgi:nicotinamide-nucleotide amidase